MKTLTFRDFEAFSANIRNADLSMMLRNITHRIWSINILNLAGIDVQLGKLGSGNIIEGQSWSNGVIFYLLLSDKCESSVNGRVIDRDSFMILEPGCEFFLSHKAAHEWCSIFIPTHMFTNSDDLTELLSGYGKPKCQVTRPIPQVANRFQSLVQQTIISAAACRQFESSLAAITAAEELQKVASLIIGNPQAERKLRPGRPRISRDEIIRRSQKLLEARKGEPILVRDLQAAVGVSERTLREAFKEYFGVGPSCYLQLGQLHQIHRLLQALEPEAVSVTQVLVEHGVWEFGRFASKYRQLFEELPSETLRTKRR